MLVPRLLALCPRHGPRGSGGLCDLGTWGAFICRPNEGAHTRQYSLASMRVMMRRVTFGSDGSGE